MTAGLWNNLGNKFTNAGSALANALFGTQNITPIQQNQTKYPEGLQNYLDSLDQKPYMQKLLNQPKETGLTLDQYKEGIAQGLNFGVPEIADAQEALKINKPKTGEEIELAKTGQFNTYSGEPLSAGLSATNRQGGLFNDITTGFRENYHNSFDPSNLAPQNKNFATRLGEGLGTVARFADSPLGRGLLAYGLNNALGYDDSGLEGITAFVGRQNARTADEIYRNNLNKLGIDTSNIKGNVTSDVYKNLADFSYKQQSLQAKKDIAEAKDNVSRARMIMSALNNGTITPAEAQLQMANYGVTLNDVQESNNTRLLPYRQYAMQVAPQVALGNLALGQGNLALNNAKFNYQMAKDEYDRNNPKGPSWNETASLRKEFTSLAPVKNSTEITRQYNNVNSLYQQYKQGKIGKNSFDQALITTLNKVLDPTSVVRESEFDRTSAGQAMWDKLAGYSQKLSKGGSGLTDANRADLVNALTTMKRANDNEVNGIVTEYADLAKRYGMNPADVMPRHYKGSTQTNTGGQVQTVGKYKVRVK